MTYPGGGQPGGVQGEGDPLYVEPWQQGWYAPATPPPPPAAGPPPAPPVPPTRRRIHPAVIVVAAICVAAALVGVLVATLTKGDVVDAPGTGGRTLAVPATISGFRVDRDVPVDDLKARLGEELADKGDDPDDVVRHAAAGAWTHVATGKRVVFIGLALRDIKSLRAQVRSDGVRGSVAFFMAGANGDLSDPARSTEFPPGPRGGFMRCAQISQGGGSSTVCAWGDESAFGMTLIDGTVPLPTAAGMARTLRAAIESD
ncbi:hypothetical protein [Jatrophihabitans fulvus]